MHAIHGPTADNDAASSTSSVAAAMRMPPSPNMALRPRRSRSAARLGLAHSHLCPAPAAQRWDKVPTDLDPQGPAGSLGASDVARWLGAGAAAETTAPDGSQLALSEAQVALGPWAEVAPFSCRPLALLSVLYYANCWLHGPMEFFIIPMKISCGLGDHPARN